MSDEFATKRREIEEKQKEMRDAKYRKILKIVVVFAVLAIFLGVLAGYIFIAPIIDGTPEIKGGVRPKAATQIFDASGNLITTIHADENRLPVELNKIPVALQNAFVAAEDVRFYSHSGIDIKSILRAVWVNLTTGRVAEGGSTITQQLVKNAFLTQEQTIVRKIQEAILALAMEQRHSKKEILGMYLNQIYFGAGAYGVEIAAQTYFDKHVQDLSLAECAMLAGIPKSPNKYSPFNSMTLAKERQAIVLNQMVEAGYITQADADAAKKAEIKLVRKTTANSSAGYFVEYVIQKLVEKYGADKVYNDGLKVYTTINMDMQKAAEKVLDEDLPKSFTDSSGLVQPQGAIVTIEPKTGFILTMVGGRGNDSFNRATMAERQPGSAFKPFVYLSALESGISPNAYVEDRPTRFGDYEPQNYNRTFNGAVSLRTALAQSLNVIAVRLAYHVGTDKVLQVAKDLGISTLVFDGPKSDRNLAMALGGLTNGTTVLDMASAYATLANDGVRMPPVAIIRVEDRTGKVLEEYKPVGKQVASRDAVRVLVDMMRAVITSGTGTGANIGRAAAGKTGTTSDYKDAWFVGFTPNLSTAVWMGNDNNTELAGITGGATPAYIWRDFMKIASAKFPKTEFPEAPSSFGNGSSIKDGVGVSKGNANDVKVQDPRDKVITATPEAGKDGKKTETNGNKQNDSTTIEGVKEKSGVSVPAISDRDKPAEKPR